MKTTTIANNATISVHFNNEIKPTVIQYSTDIEGNKVLLAEYSCDSSELEEIKEMAIANPYYESAEGFHYHTYDVLNSSLATPF